MSNTPTTAIVATIKRQWHHYLQWLMIPLILLVLWGLNALNWLHPLMTRYLPFVEDNRATLLINAFIPIIKAAFIYSIPLAIGSFILGLMIAIVVALVRVIPTGGMAHKFLLSLVKFYISAIRGTPLLVQLMIVFYGLPAIGITLNPLPTAIIGFSLNVGAYTSETIRAAILSVPKGQWEAGYTIGMTYLQTFRRIILPQAVRVAIPPLSNSFIDLFKTTSLASAITITELFRAAQQIANNSYDFLPVYIEAALVYWLFCYYLFLVQEKLERHLDRQR